MQGGCQENDFVIDMYVLKLKLLVNILPVNEKIIEWALASDFPDFEDAIQFYVAKENDIACLLTRNKKDFTKADISVMTPEEFLKLMKTINDTKSHFSFLKEARKV